MWAPALLTRMSTGPSSRSAVATIASTSEETDTSVGMATDRRPSARISSATESISERVRAATATSAPDSARVEAIARPIPRPPPVTRATRPLSENSGSRSPLISFTPGCLCATAHLPGNLARAQYAATSQSRDWPGSISATPALGHKQQVQLTIHRYSRKGSLFGDAKNRPSFTARPAYPHFAAKSLRWRPICRTDYIERNARNRRWLELREKSFAGSQICRYGLTPILPALWTAYTYLYRLGYGISQRSSVGRAAVS